MNSGGEICQGNPNSKTQKCTRNAKTKDLSTCVVSMKSQTSRLFIAHTYYILYVLFHIRNIQTCWWFTAPPCTYSEADYWEQILLFSIALGQMMVLQFRPTANRIDKLVIVSGDFKRSRVSKAWFCDFVKTITKRLSFSHRRPTFSVEFQVIKSVNFSWNRFQSISVILHFNSNHIRVSPYIIAP